MAKIIVLYEHPVDKNGFEEHYFNVHVPLVQKIPHLKDASINRVVQSQNTDLDLYLIAQLEFENMEELNEMFVTVEGKSVLGDVEKLKNYLGKNPIISITE
ncbi:EthD family reductase [Halobacillus sp. BBL2006]|uniref:EthD family reductase n=1 Tax=Halobacillus sp. BBL2006 TaxID=1543706 RepID=UPI000542162D|nr:EthD family reductase [Halobacillus sp. BBL2006]KHE67368.1 hypothetical protein LD39_17915 [Halobacillus sp. BBL2006]